MHREFVYVGDPDVYKRQLDEKTGRQVLDYICKLHTEYGFTIVMVTHNANIAEMANTVIRMNSGEIAEIYVNTVQKSAYEIGW